MSNNRYTALKQAKQRFWRISYLVCEIIWILIALLFVVYIVCTAAERETWQIAVGILLCLVCISIGTFEIRTLIKDKHEDETTPHPSEKKIKAETPALRSAETNDAYKILLEAEVGGYQIYYRRRKHINELVVNSAVYDEKKGFFESTHTLFAVIDGHKIEAGLDDMNCSFITFDGELVNYEQRIL